MSRASSSCTPKLSWSLRAERRPQPYGVRPADGSCRTEAMLREMAFVLEATRRVRVAMMDQEGKSTTTRRVHAGS